MIESNEDRAARVAAVMSESPWAKAALCYEFDEATNTRDIEIAALTREVERLREIARAERDRGQGTLDVLVGERVGFCGVDNHTIVLKTSRGLRAFEVVEDEADGYRSMLDEAREVPLADTIHFREPVTEVTVGKVENSSAFSGYEMLDRNGHVWLKAGTDYSDDYYPCFVFDYTPPLATVADVEALPRWVPVGERLPEPGTDVLVTVVNYSGVLTVERVEYRGPYGNSRAMWWAGSWEVDRVTAWMPLPAPWVAL